MPRAKAGRKKKAGDRYKCGKLRPAPDRGNDRLQALNARFRPFMQGKGDQWTGTPIGRAWLVGLLDGCGADPCAIRDAGLFYAERYWAYWPAPNGVSNYQAEDRRGGGGGFGGKDPGGQRFLRLDRMLLDAGRAAYDAVHALVVHPHWNPEADPAWLRRLIGAELSRNGATSVDGDPPRAADKERLELAIFGLLAIVGGRRRAAISGAAMFTERY